MLLEKNGQIEINVMVEVRALGAIVFAVLSTKRK